jgi:hypothetical protein
VGSTSPLQAASILTLTDFHEVSRAVGPEGQSTQVEGPALLCNHNGRFVRPGWKKLVLMESTT